MRIKIAVVGLGDLVHAEQAVFLAEDGEKKENAHERDRGRTVSGFFSEASHSRHARRVVVNSGWESCQDPTGIDLRGAYRGNIYTSGETNRTSDTVKSRGPPTLTSMGRDEELPIESVLSNRASDVSMTVDMQNTTTYQ